ncbi:acetylcholinesterase-1-like isoform X1 [Dermacentor albipictus]|uniref:acetylcholinesterase-1-like isoform X1 n=1 Tax=Dermacentor albipictus TaxID=60249 RepID=UPI0038FCD0A0
MGRGQRTLLCVLFWILAFVAVPTALALKCKTINRTEIVNTTLGPVQGFHEVILNRTIYFFLGIPFASPPVGRLRFRRPVPIAPWTNVRAAMKMPPRCKQEGVVSKEDCLYLNVWTPTMNTSRKLDVMVYFHGGAYSFERPLIQRDLRYMTALGNVVVVKMNYRLGAFGLLYSGQKYAPGNMALYDQYLALLFVRENIALFGGDPDKITAFGNSAGAMSIGLMTTSPMARHMIKRAIIQSGSPCVSMIARNDDTLQLADTLAKMVGCAVEGMTVATHPRQIVLCLRRVEADKIVDAQKVLFGRLQVFVPVFGDDMLPVHIFTALKRGLFNRDLKLLIGVTPDEGTSILNSAPTCTSTCLRTAPRTRSPLPGWAWCTRPRCTTCSASRSPPRGTRTRSGSSAGPSSTSGPRLPGRGSRRRTCAGPSTCGADRATCSSSLASSRPAADPAMSGAGCGSTPAIKDAVPAQRPRVASLPPAGRDEVTSPRMLQASASQPKSLNGRHNFVASTAGPETKVSFTLLAWRRGCHPGRFIRFLDLAAPVSFREPF